MRWLWAIIVLVVAVPVADARQYPDDRIVEVKYSELPTHVRRALQSFEACVHDRIDILDLERNSSFCGAIVFNVQPEDKSALKLCYARENIGRIGKSPHKGVWQYFFDYNCLIRVRSPVVRCPTGAELAKSGDFHFDCEYRNFNIVLQDAFGTVSITSFGKPIP